MKILVRTSCYLLIGCNVLGGAYASAACTQVAGITHCEKSEMMNLSQNGVVNLKSVTIKDKLVVNGSLWLQDTTLNQAVVNGQFDGHDSRVLGPLTLRGALRAQNCQFSGEITVTSNQVVLHDSQAETITILPQATVQYVKLSGNTRVDGVIHFVSGQGIVEVSPTAHLNGSVIGGKVMKSGV